MFPAAVKAVFFKNGIMSVLCLKVIHVNWIKGYIPCYIFKIVICFLGSKPFLCDSWDLRPNGQVSVFQAFLPQTLAYIMFSAWKDCLQWVLSKCNSTLYFPLSITFSLILSQFKHYLHRLIWSCELFSHAPPCSTAQHYVYLSGTWHNLYFQDFIVCFGSELTTDCMVHKSRTTSDLWVAHSHTPHLPRTLLFFVYTTADITLLNSHNF